MEFNSYSGNSLTNVMPGTKEKVVASSDRDTFSTVFEADVIQEPTVGANIHSSPIDGKLLCSFSEKVCMQRRLSHYAFCIRHILQDRNAPFKQCQHVARYNGQQCTNAVPLNEDRIYCNSHLVVLGIKPKKERKKDNRNVIKSSSCEIHDEASNDNNTNDASLVTNRSHSYSHEAERSVSLDINHRLNLLESTKISNIALSNNNNNNNNFHATSSSLLSVKHDPLMIRPSSFIKTKREYIQFSEWLKRSYLLKDSPFPLQTDLFRLPLEMYSYDLSQGSSLDKHKVESEIIELLKEELRQVIFSNVKIERELKRITPSAISFLDLVKRVSTSKKSHFPTQKRTCRQHKETSPCYLQPLPCCGYCELHFKFDKDQLLFGSCSYRMEGTNITCGKLSLNIDGTPSLCGKHLKSSLHTTESASNIDLASKKRRHGGSVGGIASKIPPHPSLSPSNDIIMTHGINMNLVTPNKRNPHTTREPSFKISKPTHTTNHHQYHHSGAEFIPSSNNNSNIRSNNTVVALATSEKPGCVANLPVQVFDILSTGGSQLIIQQQAGGLTNLSRDTEPPSHVVTSLINSSNAGGISAITASVNNSSGGYLWSPRKINSNTGSSGGGSGFQLSSYSSNTNVSLASSSPKYLINENSLALAASKGRANSIISKKEHVYQYPGLISDRLPLDSRSSADWFYINNDKKPGHHSYSTTSQIQTNSVVNTSTHAVPPSGTITTTTSSSSTTTYGTPVTASTSLPTTSSLPHAKLDPLVFINCYPYNNSKTSVEPKEK